MRTRLLTLLTAYVVFFIPFPTAVAQTLPADFKFSATAGGSAPWAKRATVTIDQTGQGHYARFVTGTNPAILAESTFTVSATDLERLWKSIQDSSFFTLTDRNDATVQDGEFALVTVTANGASHQAMIKNAAEPRLESIIDVLNAIVPPSLRLSYTPPQSLNIIPIDPCATYSGLIGSLGNDDIALVRSSTDAKTKAWLNTGSESIAGMTFNRTNSAAGGGLDIPHPGTVVAYDIPIEVAVRNKIATLSSKGEYFGDDISITVDNTRPLPSNTITITLFLEFYGNVATPSNITTIEADISKKWSGMRTTGGKTVNLEFVTRADATSSTPPGTPGFHEIMLAPKDAVRSAVTGGPKVNEGTGGGTWTVDDDPGTYAHEAGHLMGLPDRYADYRKQGDGSWVDAKNNVSYANDDAFANYAITKYPGLNPTTVKNAIKLTNLYSVPLEGSENDLMANVSKPPLQSDIDQIAGDPGVLVTVPPGEVLIDLDGNNQNLVVTHQDDLYVKPGEKRTQNGIYAACIDHNKGIPAKGGVFDITLPLSTWNGIASSVYMANLARLIDSVGLYCGDAITAQEAIWRISDNSTPIILSGEVDKILHAAGINIGNQIMDFPHLTPRTSKDSTSQPFIPNELYVAAISPTYSEGKVGIPAILSAVVSVPSALALKPNFSWIATGPDRAPVTVTAAGATGSLAPKRSGIYDVALSISIDDSLNGPRRFTSDRKAFVIVTDENTETFEHSGLADKFPWTSLGDVPWSVSGTAAQTGGFAAQAGIVPFGQQSTLAITISVPADSSIGFSLRSAITDYGILIFSIDSSWRDSFTGMFDWENVRYPLTAGKHLLTWSYAGSNSGVPGSVWLDNIFLPGKVFVTSSAEQKELLPIAFELEQNYPNPFNPTTLIRYGVPHRAIVNLTVYNALGQKVADLVRGIEEAGYHEVQFDGSKLASGAYFYTLTAGEFVQTRKLLLVK